MVMPTSSPAHLTRLAASLSTVLFLVQRTTQFALGSPNLRGELIVRLRKRFAQARGTSELPIHADPDALARYIAVIAWGLAVEAQSGAKRKDLYSAITVGLAAWPAGAVPTPKRKPLPTTRKSASPRSRQ